MTLPAFVFGLCYSLMAPLMFISLWYKGKMTSCRGLLSCPSLAQQSRCLFTGLYDHSGDSCLCIFKCFACAGGPALWKPTSDAFVSAVPPGTPCKAVKHAVPLCGAFAGWSHAVHLLQKQSVQIRSVADLDLEESTIKSYCVSFGPTCFSPGTPVGSFLHLHVVPPFAWHAGISDRYRQHAFSPLQCDLWSVNCPCVSWSQSGRKQGLHSEGGRVLICTTANAAMSRPLAICCEQGAEFQSHPDCEVVADFWQQAGFHINREGVFDLQEVGPVRRRRYLSALVRKVLPCAPGINVMSKWTSLGPFTPASEGAMIELPASLENQLFPGCS